MYYAVVSFIVVLCKLSCEHQTLCYRSADSVVMTKAHPAYFKGGRGCKKILIPHPEVNPESFCGGGG